VMLSPNLTKEESVLLLLGYIGNEATLNTANKRLLPFK
jgi:hypothetical protein